MEFFPVEEQEAVLRRQNSVSRARHAGREGSDERFLRLALVRHEARDVDERRHFGIIAHLGDHHSAIGMANENDVALCWAMIILVTSTSPWSEIVGFWTILTL